MQLWMLLLASVSIPFVSAECNVLNISLTQKIENDGFHREIHWLLEHNSQNCNLVLQFNTGSTIFINPDEVSTLTEPKILIKGAVDIEIPSHLAKENIVYVYINSDKEKITLNVPFHLRYQRAQISGGFGKVTIKKPSILAMCNPQCGKNSITAPCDIMNKTECKWSNVTYQALFDNLELLVPVGDLDDYPLVSIVTLLLGCAGCIYTLSILSTTPL